MATVVKAAFFIAFMRLFSDAFGSVASQWKLITAIIVAGNLCLLATLRRCFSKA
jgi:NADH-quinone oxidoreductase subunit N